MEGSINIDTPSKKAKKSRSDSEAENQSPVKKANKTVIPNGTGEIPEDSPEKNIVAEKKKNSKPIKITKAPKSEILNENTESPKKKEQSPVKSPKSTCDSPKSPSSSSDEFLGFCSPFSSKEQKEKQDALSDLIDNLSNQQNTSTSSAKEDELTKGEENSVDVEEIEQEEEDMTVDTGHASDSDSNQMEIDMSNKDSVSKSDSVEFSDKNGERTKDSDVEQMETDSVKSGGSKNVSGGTSNNANPPVVESSIIKGGKVEYCGSCDAVVNDEEPGIACDGACERWFHLGCSGLTQTEYDELSGDVNAKWACHKCSGKPQPPVKEQPPVTKPLLSVRKDLGQIATPSPTAKRRSGAREGRTPKIDISNPAFLKPFDFGWKRELVFRSANDSQNRRQGDVYYYTPKGKKLRSLREIGDYLAGSDLTIDNFTFWKDAIGINDPEKEIIRDAKLKSVNKDQNASPSVPKKVTPKTPKPTKPKLTATVTPLDSSGASHSTTPKISASVTPRVVFKGKASPAATGPKFKVTPNKTTVPGQQKITISKDKNKKRVSEDDELEMGMLPPMWEPSPPKPLPNKPTGQKRPLEDAEGSPSPKRTKADTPAPVSAPAPVPAVQNSMQNFSYIYTTLLNSFQYLKVQELLRASRVCKMWRDLALHYSLWETVRMKNSHVKDWDGFSATLSRVGTKHLDLRKILMPQTDKPEVIKAFHSECAKALSKVKTLEKLELCRSSSQLLEEITAVCPQLESITAGTIKGNYVDVANLTNCQNLTELRLKAQNNQSVITINNFSALGTLTKLKQLSLTSIKNVNEVLAVVGKLTQLESLELGDFTEIKENVVTAALSKLTKLKRLRLEKGQNDCPTPAILTTISKLPSLVQLELINFDVKVGFDDALGLCSNVKVMLIIPTYVTQSATTNHLLIEGVSKLSGTLNHFVWGLTLELLRVTDLFIDQWEMGQKKGGDKSPNQAPPQPQQKKPSSDSIPILKPSAKGKDGKTDSTSVTQVDVLQLPKLHKVLTALLPTTKIIILKVPFTATWRQTIANSSI